jgi:DNA-binding HxlR family transcriptional regulator
VPPEVEYALTERGGSLCAPVQALRAWAEEHIDEIHSARSRYDGADGR